MKYGNEEALQARHKKIKALRYELFNSIDLYLEDLGYLVDGSQHSLTFDICYEDKGLPSDESECITAIRCSQKGFTDSQSNKNLLPKLKTISNDKSRRLAIVERLSK